MLSKAEDSEKKKRDGGDHLGVGVFRSLEWGGGFKPPVNYFRNYTHFKYFLPYRLRESKFLCI